MGLSSRERRKRVLVLMAARLCRLGGGESDAGEEEEMRIADVLHEQEEEKVGSSRSGNSDGGSTGCSGRRRKQRRKGASSPSVRCLSSWWLPSRLFLRCKSLEEEGDMAMEQAVAVQDEGEVDGASSLVGSSSGTRREASGGREGEEEVVSSLEAMALSGDGWDRPVLSGGGWMQRPVGEKPEQTYLSIGMGAGLVFLLTRSVTEFNKMTELRSEMETLLKEMKGVAQKKDAGRRSSVDPKNNLACCSSISCGNMEWSNELSMQEYSSHDPSLELLEGSSVAEIGGHSSGCINKAYQEDESVRIDQMEEELKSELELLQLNLDKQESSELLSFELPCDKSNVCKYFDENSVIEHAEPKEEPEESAEGTCRDRYGVSPQELVSRLHELVEAQQQERIAELESALQLAHIKLREKEMEACWWRDTARLVSQHKQETLHR
ncbi:hypothetical protein Taro_053090 [Colocasia esculenta]|uniref:Protein POLAR LOCALIZATION DURING ASYMMETRIC DIVISION AND REDISTRIBUTION n=1 Tax=Colocasia esculenta TaxID=4460 RepID=A0A843XK95_COLES|nr:hypothetical protein [Colocasia esculenta]